MAENKTIHWDILKYNGAFRQEDGPGSTARFPVLCCLIGYSDLRSRAWPTVATIMDNVDIHDKTTISAAITWLEERGALYKVPLEKRAGKDLSLSVRRNVYQLTGIIELGGKITTYFMMDDETIADRIEEVQAINGLWTQAAEETDNGMDNPPIEDGNGRESRPSMVGNPDHNGMDNPPLSFTISSSNKLSIVADGKSASGSERWKGRRIPDPSLFQQQSESKNQGKDNDEVVADVAAIIQHPLSQLVMKTFTLQSLPRKVVKLLTGKIKYYDPDKNQHFMSNPMQLWDSEPGFKDFCEARIAQAANGKTPTADMALGSIRNVAKVATGRQWPGWFQWREQNKAVCTPAEVQLTPEQIAAGYVLETDADGNTVMMKPHVDDNLLWMAGQ